MTYKELQNRLASISHRADLTASLPDFINDARERINRRFGLSLAPFVNDDDTNAVLTDFPLLYLYPALQSLYEHLNNGDNAVYYENRWNTEIASQNINALSASTDKYSTAPPVIVPEV
jgi:hypothetical protein